MWPTRRRGRGQTRVARVQQPDRDKDGERRCDEHELEEPRESGLRSALLGDYLTQHRRWAGHSRMDSFPPTNQRCHAIECQNVEDVRWARRARPLTVCPCLPPHPPKAGRLRSGGCEYSRTSKPCSQPGLGPWLRLHDLSEGPLRSKPVPIHSALDSVAQCANREPDLLPLPLEVIGPSAHPAPAETDTGCAAGEPAEEGAL